MLQFQLCCCITQLHCNTLVTNKSYLLTYLLLWRTGHLSGYNSWCHQGMPGALEVRLTGRKLNWQTGVKVGVNDARGISASWGARGRVSVTEARQTALWIIGPQRKISRLAPERQRNNNIVNANIQDAPIKSSPYYLLLTTHQRFYYIAR